MIWKLGGISILQTARLSTSYNDWDRNSDLLGYLIQGWQRVKPYTNICRGYVGGKAPQLFPRPMIQSMILGCLAQKDLCHKQLVFTKEIWGSSAESLKWLCHLFYARSSCLFRAAARYPVRWKWIYLIAAVNMEGNLSCQLSRYFSCSAKIPTWFVLSAVIKGYWPSQNIFSYFF